MWYHSNADKCTSNVYLCKTSTLAFPLLHALDWDSEISVTNQSLICCLLLIYAHIKFDRQRSWAGNAPPINNILLLFLFGWCADFTENPGNLCFSWSNNKSVWRITRKTKISWVWHFIVVFLPSPPIHRTCLDHVSGLTESVFFYSIQPIRTNWGHYNTVYLFTIAFLNWLKILLYHSCLWQVGSIKHILKLFSKRRNCWNIYVQIFVILVKV